MKKQRYIVEIEMPDGDFIFAGWLKDLIQTDCDVEDEGRKKITVQEISLPSNLDEAAENHMLSITTLAFDERDVILSFKTGAVWMAGQGESREVEVKEDAGGYPYIPCIELYDYDKEEPLFNPGDKVVVQIRKK